MEDSFKLTILEIKSSNERLEQSLRQIEHHYISKLELKEKECEDLRRQKREQEEAVNNLERKLFNMEIEHGSQLKEKNQCISTLSTNQHQSREEIESIKKIKG